jgi:integrase
MMRFVDSKYLVITIKIILTKFTIYAIIILERKTEDTTMKGCRAIEKSEVTEILNSLNIRDKALVLTGLTFGTRISETLSLTFGNVKDNLLYIHSQKDSENAGFPIPANYRQAIEELRAYYESQGITVTGKTYLFLSREGENSPMTSRQAQRIVKASCDKLGITGNVSTHSLRKTFVTAIYNLTGKDVVATMTYSRHKNLSNLVYYIKTTEKTDLVNALAW